MSKPETFPLFSTLPSELRLAIWQYAFSDPVAISFSSEPYTTGANVTRSNLTGQPSFSTNHTHIGASCKEAWHVMTTTHEPAHFSSVTSQSESLTAWIDFSNTAFHLGSGKQAWEAIYALSTGQIAAGKIEKVVLQFRSYQEIIETLKRTDVFTELKVVEILAGRLDDNSGADEYFVSQGSIERFLGRLFGRIGKTCPKVEVERLKW